MRTYPPDFDIASPGESEVYAHDYVNDLLSGETISSVLLVTLSAVYGTDSSASSRLDGASQIGGSQVKQRITNLQAGVTYEFLTKISTTAECKEELEKLGAVQL